MSGEAWAGGGVSSLLCTSSEIEPARPEDAGHIAQLLCVAGGSCLPRSRGEVAARLSAFEVLRDASGRPLACVALERARGGCELRSLAVHPSARGAGLGRRLVERTLQRAGARVRCVSRQPEFFERFGFRRLSGAPPARAGAELASGRRWLLLHPGPCARAG